MGSVAVSQTTEGGTKAPVSIRTPMTTPEWDAPPVTAITYAGTKIGSTASWAARPRSTTTSTPERAGHVWARAVRSTLHFRVAGFDQGRNCTERALWSGLATRCIG